MIAAGAQPREYAGHLLEIAYAFGNRRVSAMAVSMARPQAARKPDAGGARGRPQPERSGARVRAAGALVAAAVLLGSPAPRRPSTRPLRKPNAPSAPRPPARLSVRWRGVSTDLRDRAPSLSRTATAAIQTVQENPAGTWELRPTEKEGVVHLRLTELNSSNGSNVPVDQLEGLTAAQLTGPGGPVQFRIRRDAGTFTFEGVLRNGVAAGTFSFSPSPSFPAELARRGFARPTGREQYQMARHDIGFAFSTSWAGRDTRSRRPPSSFAPASTASTRPTCGRWARSGIGSARSSR